jgi:hypothetical protein
VDQELEEPRNWQIFDASGYFAFEEELPKNLQNV